MDKSNRKIRPSTILIILGILIIIGLSIFTIYNFYEYKKYEKEKNNLNTSLSEKSKDLNYLMEDQAKILEDLNHLKDIDNVIEQKKLEVFSKAKDVEQRILNGETNYKIAYLTFDDGPYYLTYSFLETLKQYKVKGTFFTIGLGKERCFDNGSYDCTEVYSKIVENGHTIANHTYSHAIFYGLYNSSTSFIDQVKKQEENISSRTGVKTNIVRFPGGSATAGNLKNGIIEKLRENGYGWVDWTAADGDGGSLDSRETAWRNFTNSINENIEVVLFHDYNRITLNILPDVINYLEENNYIILPLFYDSVVVNK